MTNVRIYLETAFPKHCYRDRSELENLESMPLDSVCGAACKIAVERARALDDLIREGHGRYYGAHVAETQSISQVAVDLCLLYICG